MKNLDIYFSDACNSNCQYCIIQDLEHNNNMAIRQALEDNTFVTYARKVLTPETNSIGFWGKEPTINGQYFSKFITNILDYSPYIQYVILSTDGQSLSLFQNFIAPLYCYCNSHKRKIIFVIQFSLDGPPDLQDKYRGEGSVQKCLNTIEYIYNNFNFSNKYLRLRLLTKSIINGYEIENYSPDVWGQYMDTLAINYANKDQGYTISHIGQAIATVEVPGNDTVDQGKALIKWKKYIKINTGQFISCIANTNNKTLDYLGNLYDCHSLINKDITQKELRTQFETTMDTLVAANEAIEQDRDKLFNAISSIYCWGAADKKLDSYIRLLGNGFLL